MLAHMANREPPNVTITKLFESYTEAFDALDPVKIAQMYRLPCAVTDGDGVQTFNDVKSLTDKFTKNCAQMRNFGYQRAKFNILRREDLSQTQVAVYVGWCIETETSKLTFRTLYVCHFIDKAWRIFSANVYPGSFS